MLISDSYRHLNTDLHSGGNYGRHGDKWADKVVRLAAQYHAGSVLDYGCGQGSLARALDLDVREYDPAIAGKSARPDPADLVVCTDVLEHIEPDCLDDVLTHLCGLARTTCFVVVATRPAKKVLADGRNAHLIVESDDFWRARFASRFKIVSWEPLVEEFAAVLEPLRGWPAISARAGALLRRLPNGI